jgi:xylan 1,4-beta-xylosidase
LSTRRDVLKSILASAATSAARPADTAAAETGTGAQGVPAGGQATWARGVEGQRRADLGNGTFLNPILAGDHPDPTILKDGDDYYMTFSSFEAVPGIVIWHSRDLVNWVPVGPALTKLIGSVWAMDLIKHEGRYYVYIPVQTKTGQMIMVIHAETIRGPWSDPIDLRIPGHIDPGHAVGEDGRRYLFLNGGKRVRLGDDGLATDGPVTQAYELWKYPDDWIVEMYSGEGPKLLRRGGYFYLIGAVGGTAGPPTGHMVVVSRSRSIHGPWEQCPHNPIVRTTDARERWWSRGHASLVEGPDGQWWMVYHGYENGYYTLGRQALLEPIEWTEDGWFRARGGDLSQPIAKPSGGRPGPAGIAFSDDFSTNRFGLHWSFHGPGPDEVRRVRYEPKALVVSGKGTGPQDSSPFGFNAGDHAYEISVVLEPRAGAQGGLLLFYNPLGFVGLGFDGRQVLTFNFGQEHGWLRIPVASERLHLRLANDRHIVTMHYSADGRAWERHPWRYEVSGYHHNVFGGFLNLRPSLYAASAGEVRYSDFRYRAL